MFTVADGLKNFTSGEARRRTVVAIHENDMLRAFLSEIEPLQNFELLLEYAEGGSIRLRIRVRQLAKYLPNDLRKWVAAITLVFQLVTHAEAAINHKDTTVSIQCPPGLAAQITVTPHGTTGRCVIEYPGGLTTVESSGHVVSTA
jgi:hypothetical protein